MKPVLQALVLADHVYEDRLSRKKVIAGTFTHMRIGTVTAKSVEHPDGSKRATVLGGTDIGCPWVYVSLTDVVDGTVVELRMINLTTNESLFNSGPIKIQTKDRLGTIEIFIPLPPARSFATTPCTLSMDLVWEDEILGSHRLRVTAIEPPPEKVP